MIDLFDYQREAVNRMLFEPGFILGDEMGLGKTYQALAELREYAAQDHRTDATYKVLIVAPKSVHSVWEDAIVAMGLDWPVLAVDGAHKANVAKYRNGFLIVNSEALRLIPALALHHWDYVIADEAHVFKNRQAKRTKALKKIKADHKRALSGTPFINRPDELWSLLNWLDKKNYGSYWRFFEEYIDYEIGYPGNYKIIKGPKNVDKLRELLKPIMIRRLKADVLKELPDKYYTTIRVDLTPQQRKAYDEMRKDSLAWIEQQPTDAPVAAPMVLARLTRLRQFASAYGVVEAAPDVELPTSVRMAEPSSKLDALMDILSDTSEPIVVFSQFKQLIQLAAERTEKTLGKEYVAFTGDTPQRARANMIERFQRGDVPIFFATLQAGGVGITLHRASTVVFLDRAWSPAMNMQAEDRLHRIGQKNAVQVINIAANDTVDQVVEEKLELKWDWIKRILN